MNLGSSGNELLRGAGVVEVVEADTVVLDEQNDHANMWNIRLRYNLAGSEFLFEHSPQIESAGRLVGVKSRQKAFRDV